MTEDFDYDDEDTLDETAEELDEDELGFDPGEEGYDAPDEWSASDRWGTTPEEEHEGESLDQRLREEEPDVEP
jgi:hypothetical protein